MHKLPKMVDMARTPDEKAEGMMPSIGAVNDYPYGLCISFCQDEIEKLGLDTQDVEVGDMLHLFALCKVTSISKNDTGSGAKTRIEMQITHIAEENEDEENEEAAPAIRKLRTLKYSD